MGSGSGSRARKRGLTLAAAVSTRSVARARGAVVRRGPNICEGKEAEGKCSRARFKEYYPEWMQYIAFNLART